MQERQPKEEEKKRPIRLITEPPVRALNLVERSRIGPNNLTIPTPESWDEFIPDDVLTNIDRQDTSALSTKEYLCHINHLAIDVINSPDYHDKQGYISNAAWKRLVEGGMLAPPLEERDNSERLKEMMHTLRILSYHDINLGLSYGITVALAILPLKRYRRFAGQNENILDLIKNGKRVGLAVTEKEGSGTDALNMKSQYESTEDGRIKLHIEKQFQGLSGYEGLIVAAKKKYTTTSTIGLIYVNNEQIHSTRTTMIGLKGIRYAVNEGDVELNVESLMQEIPRSELGSLFQDMFTQSRLLFIGMPLGHQERMEQEANAYASERTIGGILQSDMDIPKEILKDIRARRIATEAMLNRVTSFEVGGQQIPDIVTKDLVAEADMVKVLSTQYAVDTASDRAKLRGGSAYYSEGALQDYINIRAFSIFEGNEDFLYVQIGHQVLKGLSKNDANNNGFALTKGTNMPYNETLKSKISQVGVKLAQYKKVTPVPKRILGKIFAREFALECVYLDKKNLSPSDYEIAIDFLTSEIKNLANQFLDIKIPEE